MLEYQWPTTECIIVIIHLLYIALYITNKNLKFALKTNVGIWQFMADGLPQLQMSRQFGKAISSSSLSGGSIDETVREKTSVRPEDGSPTIKV